MYSVLSAVATAALLLTPASAQTWTTCNPLKKSCPNDPGLNQKHFVADFVKDGKKALSHFKTTAGQIEFGKRGARFTLAKKGDAPTIQSNFHIFFGRVEVEMLAAPGQGVISSVVLQSSDLDEIDWEFVGSDTKNGQTNYFGKGNTTTYDRGAYLPLAQPPQLRKHTYAVDWNKDRIQYIINGKVVRTVPYNDPKALYGKNYPQTPSNLRIGIWAGGDPSNSPGTISWAGGPINYGAAPYTMIVSKITVTNNNPAASYKYSDRSGSYKSIKKIGAPKSKRELSDEAADMAAAMLLNRRSYDSYSSESCDTTVTVHAPLPTLYSPIPYAPSSIPYVSSSAIAPIGTGSLPPPSSPTAYNPTNTLPPTPPPSASPTGAAAQVKAHAAGLAIAVLGMGALL